MNPDLVVIHSPVGGGHKAAALATVEAARARVDSGRWQRVHRGVFATFSGPLTRSATIWAAWLSCGATSAISHATAAELAGLTDEVRAEVHVTVAHELLHALTRPWRTVIDRVEPYLPQLALDHLDAEGIHEEEQLVDRISRLLVTLTGGVTVGPDTVKGPVTSIPSTQ